MPKTPIINSMQGIETINLCVGYHGHSVVEDINLSLPCGRMACILGSNGAGKSTLLRTLCGFQSPLSGTVNIGGSDINHLTPAGMARRVSVVLTYRPDTPSLTAEEMVAMGRAPYTGFWGSLGKTDRDIVQQAMLTVGITTLANRRMGQLSDGERQKVMIAKALAQQTPVILLDEPTAFLDYASKVAVMKTLSHLAHNEEKTILISTHDLELAARIADCLLEIRNQRIVKVSAHEVSLSIDHMLER